MEGVFGPWLGEPREEARIGSEVLAGDQEDAAPVSHVEGIKPTRLCLGNKNRVYPPHDDTVKCLGLVAENWPQEAGELIEEICPCGDPPPRCLCSTRFPSREGQGLVIHVAWLPYLLRWGWEPSSPASPHAWLLLC